jgi:site-specific recombinase XerD
MTLLAPTLQAWFTDRLLTQRKVSPHTIASYRDAIRLLLTFAQQQTGKAPSKLDFADLDAPLIGAFLNHLEQDRGNSPRTRNARLAAIHSLFRYSALRHPEHAASIARVLEIPTKRHRQTVISYLERPEIDALLEAPDRTTWLGRRDHAMILVAIQTGVRVSELVNLTISAVSLTTGAHLKVLGKGRKERSAILTTETVAVLREWLREREGHPHEPLFPTRRGGPLTPRAFALLLDKHTATAARVCPSLTTKRVTPHVYADLLVMPTSTSTCSQIRSSWRWGRHNASVRDGPSCVLSRSRDVLLAGNDVTVSASGWATSKPRRPNV